MMSLKMNEVPGDSRSSAGCFRKAVGLIVTTALVTLVTAWVNKSWSSSEPLLGKWLHDIDLDSRPPALRHAARIEDEAKADQLWNSPPSTYPSFASAFERNYEFLLPDIAHPLQHCGYRSPVRNGAVGEFVRHASNFDDKIISVSAHVRGFRELRRKDGVATIVIELYSIVAGNDDTLLFVQLPVVAGQTIRAGDTYSVMGLPVAYGLTRTMKGGGLASAMYVAGSSFLHLPPEINGDFAAIVKYTKEHLDPACKQDTPASAATKTEPADSEALRQLQRLYRANHAEFSQYGEGAARCRQRARRQE